MESLREKVANVDLQAQAIGFGGSPEAGQDKPRLWKVTIIANLAECRIDNEYVVVHKECVARSEYEAKRKLGIEFGEK